MLNYKIIRKKIGDILADLVLPAPTQEEQIRISDLRSGIHALQPLTETSSIISEQEWNRNRIKLRKNILQRDPRNFLRWPVVLFTMFHESKPEELAYLQSLSVWPHYESALVETPIGHPKPYPALPASSGNLVHQTYSLALLSETFSVPIAAYKSIFEFGGGYGSLARLVYRLGFSGHYTIFDLPEFSLLQKYYLSSSPDLTLSFDASDRPDTISSVTSIAEIKKNPIDLFIALWSLSESPLELRTQLLSAIPEPAYFLIAYQEDFNNIDNTAYFKTFVAERPQYTWTGFPIKHLSGHRYLLGKKNG